MLRRNLGRGRSGVIVDICARHGIWFDADELSQMLVWIRTGGLEALRTDLARLHTSKDPSRRRQAWREERRTEDRSEYVRSDPFNEFAPADDDDLISELATAAIQYLSRVFRRF
jgi:Zn-finger nucleic acid-binding protein